MGMHYGTIKEKLPAVRYMLFFAHLGITLAAGCAAGKISNRCHGAQEKQVDITFSSEVNRIGIKKSVSGNGIRVKRQPLGDYIDYRFLLVGSLLPDIIDKPIGGILFFSVFQNSRIFAHTLLFSVLLIALGVFVQSRLRRPWLLALGFGSLGHLVLDEMWRYPETLLWPAYGWVFPKGGTRDFIGNF